MVTSQTCTDVSYCYQPILHVSDCQHQEEPEQLKSLGRMQEATLSLDAARELAKLADSTTAVAAALVDAA
jgi:hypothetical protein